jgi:hypothetical protein
VSLQFAVVHEAPADFLIATELADRVLLESVDWLEEDQVEHQRTWIRESGGVPLTWTRIKQSARDAGINAIGFFDGHPAAPDARAARRAILYLLYALPDLAAVLLIRDRDDQPERRTGLEQARQQEHQAGSLRIVIGLAVVERESWVISGFEPQGEAETTRLDVVRRELGFDPRLGTHELTACKADNALRSPKRVLRALTIGDAARERRCWTETTLPTLRSGGGDNGLGAFLNEVRDELASLIGHVSAKGTGP